MKRLYSLVLAVSFFSYPHVGHTNDIAYDGKITVADAIYALQVVSGASSPSVPDLVGTWDLSGTIVQIADYTENGQTATVVTYSSGPVVYITTQNANVFSGYSTAGSSGDGNTIYVTGTITGDKVVIQERHQNTWHILTGYYTFDGTTAKIEGTFYGNEDNGTPPSSAESGTFVATKR